MASIMDCFGSAPTAIREGDWKLVRLKAKPDELYHLATDIGESRNVADANPEMARRLATALDSWTGELVAPAFPGSSVKDEDWGPGGANQKARQSQKSKQKETPPARQEQKP